MSVIINASSVGLTETVDTSGNLAFQTANTSALILDTSLNANFASTTAIIFPVGTTAQRPTPANGMVRYNTTTVALEAYSNNTWVPFVGFYSYSISYLIVAGGGGGGAGGGGSANAGGNGYQGIVIISLATAAFSNSYTGSNVAIATSGSNTIVSFYANGTYTA